MTACSYTQRKPSYSLLNQSSRQGASQQTPSSLSPNSSSDLLQLGSRSFPIHAAHPPSTAAAPIDLHSQTNELARVDTPHWCPIAHFPCTTHSITSCLPCPAPATHQQPYMHDLLTRLFPCTVMLSPPIIWL